MPSYQPSTIQSVADLISGLRVDRATATLPQTTNVAIYTISGGRVLLWYILGEVTTAIQNQVNNTKLTAVPSAGSNVDICAVVNIANLEVGAKLTITGTLANAMLATNAGAASMQDRPVTLAAGSLKLDCAASNTGSVKWSMWWTPVDDGASVVAA